MNYVVINDDDMWLSLMVEVVVVVDSVSPSLVSTLQLSSPMYISRIKSYQVRESSSKKQKKGHIGLRP